MKRLIITCLAAVALCSVVSCNKNQPGNAPSATCHNGVFIGEAESATGVISFKGIPYAKAPVGDLRWKAPVWPENSSKTQKAKEYGYSSIQYYWHSEPIRTEVSEECLTLNVWTSDMNLKNKPVMLFIHGGAFAWGGSSEEIYDGQYFVKNNPDILLVTCNYRVGIMGFACFDGVPGSSEFPDSYNLGVLDVIMALKWVKENAAAFGGDASRVTVFGESAGGGIISALLATDAAGTLFHRAIIESGAANQVITVEQARRNNLNVQALMALTGSSSMEDLCSLSETDLIEANETPLDEDGNTINDIYTLPVRGTGLISDDIYTAIGLGKAAGVDVMIGTNLDEMAYWVNEMGEVPMSEMDEEGVATNLYCYEEYFLGPAFDKMVETVSADDLKCINDYLNLYSDIDPLWARTRLLSDVYFRAPSIRMAEAHTGRGAGKTYMYLFEKKNDTFDFMGSCHAVELPYVFLNSHHQDEYGHFDMDLALKVNAAWASFARTGIPISGSDAWPEYDLTTRKTMVMGDDGSMTIKSDPYSEERELSSCTVKYGLLPSGA